MSLFRFIAFAQCVLTSHAITDTGPNDHVAVAVDASGVTSLVRQHEEGDEDLGDDDTEMENQDTSPTSDMVRTVLMDAQSTDVSSTDVRSAFGPNMVAHLYCGGSKHNDTHAMRPGGTCTSLRENVVNPELGLIAAQGRDTKAQNMGQYSNSKLCASACQLADPSGSSSGCCGLEHDGSCWYYPEATAGCCWAADSFASTLCTTDSSPSSCSSDSDNSLKPRDICTDGSDTTALYTSDVNQTGQHLGDTTDLRLCASACEIASSIGNTTGCCALKPSMNSFGDLENWDTSLWNKCVYYPNTIQQGQWGNPNLTITPYQYAAAMCTTTTTTMIIISAPITDAPFTCAPVTFADTAAQLSCGASAMTMSGFCTDRTSGTDLDLYQGRFPGGGSAYPNAQCLGQISNPKLCAGACQLADPFGSTSGCCGMEDTGSCWYYPAAEVKCCWGNPAAGSTMCTTSASPSSCSSATDNSLLFMEPQGLCQYPSDPNGVYNVITGALYPSDITALYIGGFGEHLGDTTDRRLCASACEIASSLPLSDGCCALRPSVVNVSGAPQLDQWVASLWNKCVYYAGASQVGAWDPNQYAGAACTNA